MTQEELDNQLFRDLSEIIESGKNAIVSHITSTLTLLYWQVERRIKKEILGNGRAK